MLDARYWMEQCEGLNIKRTGRLELDTRYWMEQCKGLNIKRTGKLDVRYWILDTG